MSKMRKPLAWYMSHVFRVTSTHTLWCCHVLEDKSMASTAMYWPAVAQLHNKTGQEHSSSDQWLSEWKESIKGGFFWLFQTRTKRMEVKKTVVLRYCENIMVKTKYSPTLILIPLALWSLSTWLYLWHNELKGCDKHLMGVKIDLIHSG